MPEELRVSEVYAVEGYSPLTGFDPDGVLLHGVSGTFAASRVLPPIQIFCSDSSGVEVFVVEVLNFLIGEEFSSLIRGTGLQFNANLRPYHSSDIRLQSLEIETLCPLAKYVLEENLVYLDRTRTALLAKGFNIFDLAGRIEVISGAERFFLAPPIIEEWPGEGRLIVDGIHRIWLARRYNIKSVTCVLISNAEMPLVPLPVSWDEVREYKSGNYPEEKRVYRFNKLSDVASTEQAKEWGVTVQNFRYFYFRNLSHLGSTGIREFDPS